MKFFQAFIIIVLLALPTLANPLTTGPAEMLIITLEFDDVSGYPLTPTQIETRYQAAVDQIHSYSYGTATINVTLIPALLTLPGAKADYANSGWGTGSTILANQADTLAASAGYDVADYDIVSYLFRRTFAGDSGLAQGKTGRQWINSDNPHPSLLAHETGHNYGMGHASSWTTNNGSIFGVDGNWREYGDPFDLMGSSPNSIFGQDFINPSLSGKPGWFPSDRRVDVSQGGTFELYRFDHELASSTGPIVLYFQAPGGEVYSLSYRHLFQPGGLFIHWNRNGFRSWLLDATPDSESPQGSLADRRDGALPLGKTFTDPTGQIRITNVGTGGTAPNYFLKIKVEFNPGNPSGYTLDLPPRVPAFAEVPFEFNQSGNWSFNPAVDSVNSLVTFSTSNNLGTLTAEQGLPAGGNIVVSASSRLNNPLRQFLPVTQTAPLPIKSMISNGSYLFSCGSGFIVRLDGPFQSTLSSRPGVYRDLVANDDGVVVSVLRRPNGQGGIIYSNDNGDTWLIATTPAGISELWGVTYHDGLFVAVGADTTILTSSDGESWIDVSPIAQTVDLYTVAYGNGIWTAAGEEGTILTSSDGMDWVRVAGSSGTAIRRLVELDGYWYATGSGFSLIASADNWDTVTKILDDGLELTTLSKIGHALFTGGRDLMSSTPVAFIAAAGTIPKSLPWSNPGNPIYAVPHQGRLYVTTSNNVTHASGTFHGLTGLPEEWTTAFFPSGVANGDFDDPDNDGQSNLLEYATGTHPLISDFPPLGLWRMSDDSFRYYSFPQISLVSAALGKSTNLFNWSPVTPLTTSGAAFYFQDSSPSSSANFFQWTYSPLP